jgi:hypothetical protein
MSYSVVFKVDGGQRVQYQLTDVAVPPAGADITIDDGHYFVEKVDYTYWSDIREGSAVAWVTSRRFSSD